MFSITLTNHARMRMQQRGIAPEALASLLDVGQSRASQGGRELVFVDKHERRRLSDRQKLQRHGRDRFCGLYAVTDERGALITVGHRYRRLTRGTR